MIKKITSMLIAMALMVTIIAPVMGATGDNIAGDIFGLNIAFSKEANDGSFFVKTEATTGVQKTFCINVFVGNDADKLVNVKRSINVTSNSGISKLEIKDTDNKWKSLNEYNKSIVTNMNRNEFAEVHITFIKAGNYTVEYSLIDANNKEILKKTLTIAVTGKDLVTEQVTKANETTKKQNTPTVQQTGAKIVQVGTSTIKINATKVKKAVKGKNSKTAKVMLKKIKNVQGYQIQFSTTKKFKKVLVNKKVKKYNVTIKSNKLKGKKRIYVRARVYRTINKKNYYGNWTKVKKVTIKK